MRFIQTVVSITTVALLSGCATGVAEPDASTPAPSDSSPSASPTPTEPASSLPDGALYAMTATFVSEEGATLTAVQTVFEPVEFSDVTADELALFDAECDDWRTQYPDATFLRSTFSTSVDGGAWPAEGAEVGITTGHWSVYTGDTRAYQSYCTGGFVDVPGSGTAISILSDSVIPPQSAWQSAEVGFGYIGRGPGDEEPPLAHLDTCTIELSDLAAADPATATWPTIADDVVCATLRAD